MDVWYHTDGQVRDIFGDLIEIGVQVINCQVPVVGHDWIAQNVRGRVAFRTDIDRQRVMPFGSISEVKEEVHRTLEACGSSKGGIVACGEVGPICRWKTSAPCTRRFASMGLTYDPKGKSAGGLERTEARPGAVVW